MKMNSIIVLNTDKKINDKPAMAFLVTLLNVLSIFQLTNYKINFEFILLVRLSINQLLKLLNYLMMAKSQLRKEKIDLENHLEAEQEQFVNRLWKRMEQLENEKR